MREELWCVRRLSLDPVWNQTSNIFSSALYNQKILSLRDWWKTGVTKQVYFSEGIVFSGATQALQRTGYWELVSAMQCNMQCKLRAHCSLPLESASHCELWGGLHMSWSVCTSWWCCWAFTSTEPNGLMLGFSQGQWWFTYLCGKGRNNRKADHLLCLMFLKPQISRMKYLDLHKGKVFPVCIIHMWVTICLKLGNITYMLSACFPYVVLYTFVSDVKSCLLSWAKYFLLYLLSFHCCTIRCERG